MALLNKYQIYCNTENSWKYIWDTVEPTVCPTNVAHTINANSIASIDNTIGVTLSGITSSARPELLLCDTTSNSINVLLPSVSLNNINSGLIRAKKMSANNIVSFIASQSQLINGNSGFTLTSNNEYTALVSNGTGWSTVDIKNESQYNNNYSSYVNNSIALSSTYQFQNSYIIGPIRQVINTPNGIATDSSFVTVGSYVYPGSNLVGAPVSVKSVVRGGTGDIRLFSLSGATAIAQTQVNGIQSDTVVSLPLTNNINSIRANEDTWEVQLRRNIQAGGGNIFSQVTTVFF